MIVVMYEGVGRVPSKKNSKRIFRRGGRTIVIPSKIHEKWHKQCMIDLKEGGLPNIPIQRVKVCKCTIYYPDHHAADNTNKVESIHDLLVDVGILIDDNWKVLPSTFQQASYRKAEGGFKIHLTIDEAHPDNEGLILSSLPIIEDLSTDY